jgi:MFS family permease
VNGCTVGTAIPAIERTMLLTGTDVSWIFPVASATIGDVFPTEKRGRALGIPGAVFGIAFIVGPVTMGFGHAFMILAIISAGLVLLSVFLKNQKEEFNDK